MADVILIPKQLRMDWVDVMALDPRLSDAAFRVACIIGTHFGNKSGLAYLGQETLASVSHLSIATVQRSIKSVETSGYLIVRRREFGERGDGRKVYGARGTANEYLPAIDANQISATDRGQRLTTRARAFWDERAVQKHITGDVLPGRDNASTAEKKHLTGDVLSGGKHLTGDVLSHCESTSFEPRKDLTGDVPTLTSPSEKNSTASITSDALGAVGPILRKMIGESEYRSWFVGKMAVVSYNDGLVVLRAPSDFVRVQVEQRYSRKLLLACQAVHPGTTEVRIVLHSDMPGAEISTSGDQR
jgi:Helix-turn-helix domain/DnaA N-terminal domain